MKLFKELDTSGDGRLSRNELDQLIMNKQLVEWMSVLDMEPHHVVILFDMFDNGSGEISVEEFVLGASRVKGPAKSIAMARVLCAAARMEHCLVKIQNLSSTAEHLCSGARCPE